MTKNTAYCNAELHFVKCRCTESRGAVNNGKKSFIRLVPCWSHQVELG
jgi:hypothetical protein